MKETHHDSSQRGNDWNTESPDLHCLRSPDISHSAEVAIWMKKHLSQFVVSVRCDQDGRPITVMNVLKFVVSLNFLGCFAAKACMYNFVQVNVHHGQTLQSFLPECSLQIGLQVCYTFSICTLSASQEVTPVVHKILCSGECLDNLLSCKP